MLNRIIHWSLANRLSVLILSLVIFIAGIFTLLRTDVDIFPDLNAPTVVVMTEAPGMAPEEVEKIVTFPIETAVNGATGVRRVRSSSTTGFSVVTVEFDWSTNIHIARQIVSERLMQVSDQLPATVKSPVMGPESSILGEMYMIGLQSDSTSLMDLRNLADRVIKPQLLAMGGVAQVSVQGGDAREYRILFDPERMRSYNVTLDQLIAACDGLNDNAQGGIVYDYGNEYIIKGDINTTWCDDIAAAVVRADADGIVTVGDVADVNVGGAVPRIGLASLKAHPAVIITVTKQNGVGTIALTDQINERLAALQKTLPADVKIDTDIFRQSDFIDASISNLMSALMEGAFFVVIVLFLFLMNIRTTIISLTALPISLVITILILNALGYTINTMSLGGIAIAIGSLVDDAIVDVENVYKRLRQNRALPPSKRQPLLKAVYEASAEVRMPIFNSSLIIIASFMPLFFLSGMEGRLLIPLGVSFIVALIASTIVALTVTPTLCAYLLAHKSATDEKKHHEPWLTRKMRAIYMVLLNFTISHTKLMLTSVAVMFAAAAVGFCTIGRSFLPSFNEGSFTINVGTLPGVSLEESDKIAAEAERIIMSVPEVRNVARKTGRAELAEHSLGPNVSEMEVPYTLTDRSRTEVANEIRQKLMELPGVNIEVGQPISHRIDAMLSGTKSQIAIKIFGDDLSKLYMVGSNVKSLIAGIPGVVDANIEQQVERPQLVIRPRRQLLAQYGITMAEFNCAISTAIGGRTVSQVYDQGLPYEVKLYANEELRTSLEGISRLTIDSNRGPVPLAQVAEIVSTVGPNTINREDVKRRIIVSANVDGRDLRSVVNDIQSTINTQVQLPENYYVTYGGQFESEERASRTLMLTSICALLVILMLLYAQFKSWIDSAIILINIPLALIGGVFILLITGAELNIPAIIGFISLLGITTRNGMLLISHYKVLHDEGHTLKECILIGSSDRLLPIIMTALTSALAMIPLAVNGEKTGNEIQAPMAMVILGGLISSTILNVFVVPALYRWVNIKKLNR